MSTTTRFPHDAWFKSSFSTDDRSGCVEVALSPAAVGLRDTKNRTLPAHTYAPGAWEALLGAVAAGEFDLPGAA